METEETSANEIYVCETCGDGCGWIWPTTTDDNDDHQWVERCDKCDRFQDDFAARDYIADRLARNGFVFDSGVAFIVDIDAPYIDNVRLEQKPVLELIVGDGNGTSSMEDDHDR